MITADDMAYIATILRTRVRKLERNLRNAADKPHRDRRLVDFMVRDHARCTRLADILELKTGVSDE